MPNQHNKQPEAILFENSPLSSDNSPSSLTESPTSHDRSPQDNRRDVLMTQQNNTPNYSGQYSIPLYSGSQGAATNGVISGQTNTSCSHSCNASPLSSQNGSVVSSDQHSLTMFRDKLMSVPVSDDFIKSPAVEAVKEYLPSGSDGQTGYLIILLAAKLFIVQHCRTPHAHDILTILEAAEYLMKGVVDMFVVLCQTFGGVHNLPYFQSNLRSETTTNLEHNIAFEFRSVEEQTINRTSVGTGPIGANNMDHSCDFPNSLEVSSTESISGATSQPQDVPHMYSTTHGSSPTPPRHTNIHGGPSITSHSNIQRGSSIPSHSNIQRGFSDPTTENCTLSDNDPHTTDSGFHQSAGASHSPVANGGLTTDKSERSLENVPSNPAALTDELTQLRALEREEMYLKRLLTCAMCSDAKAEVTFLPCGHFIACSACADPCRVCPKCEREVLAEVKTYIS